ncbi:MAG: GTPase [Leeuwenhoekiella sp.]
MIFIYNAKSGKGQALLDSAHKFFSPKTYPCSLCELTYGTFGEKADWKKFRESFDIPLEFLHRDEIQAAELNLPSEFELPVILAWIDGKPLTLIQKQELASMESVGQLIAAITEKANLTRSR